MPNWIAPPKQCRGWKPPHTIYTGDLWFLAGKCENRHAYIYERTEGDLMTGTLYRWYVSELELMRGVVHVADPG